MGVSGSDLSSESEGEADDEEDDDELHEELLQRVLPEARLREFDQTEIYTVAVMQFGLVIIFGGLWPLAALVAMVNSLVDLRAHAASMTFNQRRATPWRVSGIGPWTDFLSILVMIAAVFNVAMAFFVGPAADRLDALGVSVPWRWAGVIAAEHIFAAFMLIIMRVIEPASLNVREILRKYEYEAKIAMFEGNQQGDSPTLARSGGPLDERRWNATRRTASELVAKALQRDVDDGAPRRKQA